MCVKPRNTLPYRKYPFSRTVDQSMGDNKTPGKQALRSAQADHMRDLEVVTIVTGGCGSDHNNV